MPREQSLYPADWLRIAEKDIGRVEVLLEAHDPDAAGVYLQQAVEKFLKAFLLSKGGALERTHDLEVLLNAALAHEPSFEQFRPVCQKITGFYFVQRYPFVRETSLTEDDVRGSRAQVLGLIEIVRQKTR